MTTRLEKKINSQFLQCGGTIFVKECMCHKPKNFEQTMHPAPKQAKSQQPFPMEQPESSEKQLSPPKEKPSQGPHFSNPCSSLNSLVMIHVKNSVQPTILLWHHHDSILQAMVVLPHSFVHKETQRAMDLWVPTQFDHGQNHFA